MSVDKKIISTLRKLIAKQESLQEAGSEAEAQLFAAKVQELLLQHKLSLTEVEAEEEAVTQVVGDGLFRYGPHKSRRVRWQENLAAILADAFGCKILVGAGSNTMRVIGRELDRELFLWMFRYLAAVLVRTENSEYWKLYSRLERAAGFAGRGATDATYGFRESYRTGFLNRLHQRLEERKAAAVAAAQTTTALVVLDKAVVEAFNRIRTGDAAQLKGDRDYNMLGRAAGQKNADTVNLDARVLRNSEAKAPEQITKED